MSVQQHESGKKRIRTTVTVPAELLARVDQAAKNGMVSSRSEFVQIALQQLAERFDAETAPAPWRTNEDQPLTLEERRAFLKLPMALRRKIMAEQAVRVEAFYMADTERGEWQSGDILEE